MNKFAEDVMRRATEKLAELGFAPIDRSGMSFDGSDMLGNAVANTKKKSKIKSLDFGSVMDMKL
jgi:hypothetical protein